MKFKCIEDPTTVTGQLPVCCCLRCCVVVPNIFFR